MSKIIEFVCSHNQGRSPIAEAFGQRYIAKLGGRGGYIITSSGHMVDEIEKMRSKSIDIPLEGIQELVNLSVNRGFNTEGVEDFMEGGDLSTGQVEKMQRVALYALERFIVEEHGYRARAFTKLGLGEPRKFREQTKNRPGTVLILGMAESNVNGIRRVYGENGPIIDTLAGWATETPGAEFKGAFGKQYEDYMGMAEVIKGYVRGSIDRALADNI